MKFCYLDESGVGSTSILVMAGIIVDAQRMHVTKEAWSDFLDYCSNKVGKVIKEFHFRDFYNGNGPWRAMDGPIRTNLISAIIDWIGNRKHKITYSAIKIDNYKVHIQSNKILSNLHSSWCAAAMHCILSLQKHHQNEVKTKGHTVLVFDREVKEEQKLSDLVSTPPNCISSYCPPNKKGIYLDKIVDVPYFADSKPVLLIQVADLVSYVLRRYVELVEDHEAEKYHGEKTKMTDWTQKIMAITLPSSTRYLSKGRCETAQIFWDIAPHSLRRFS